MIRVVGNRVDALTLAWRVKLNPDALAELDRVGRGAFSHGRAHYVDPFGEPWEMKIPRSATGGTYDLRREGHVRMRVQKHAPGGSPALASPEYERGDDVQEIAEGKVKTTTNVKRVSVLREDGREVPHELCEPEPGWTVDAIYDAQYLAGHDLDDVIREACALAERFGRVLEVRVRRLDLAADVEGWDHRPDDWQRIVRHPHMGLVLYNEQDDAAPVPVDRTEAFSVAGNVTGWRAGSGMLVCRCYDKLRELRKADPSKADAERERWARNGYEGGNVARVEFQLRGDVLKEFGARNPFACCLDDETGELGTLGRFIARLWTSCVSAVRLAVPSLTRSGAQAERTRWVDDDRWAVLRAVRWDRVDHRPVRRVRVRGAARAAQVIGSMATHAGSVDAIPRYYDEHPHTYADDAPRKLRELLELLAAWNVDALERALVERWGDAQAACVHLAVVLNASRARFAYVNGRKEETNPWQQDRTKRTRPDASQRATTLLN